MLWAFIPIAIMVTVTPGSATALVIRSALRGGRRAALATIAANSVCVLVWGALSVLGISALVATSAAAVIRVRHGLIGRRVAAALERATGAVLVALGVRVAFD